MLERSDQSYTLISDRDLHDHEFYCAHHHASDHLSLTIPLNHHHHRTVHLSASQCHTLGTRLLKFARTRNLTDPQHSIDFII